MNAQLVTVCAWCPDKAARDAAAAEAGHDVTHGICPDCAARLVREIAHEDFTRPKVVRFSCALRCEAA